MKVELSKRGENNDLIVKVTIENNDRVTPGDMTVKRFNARSLAHIADEDEQTKVEDVKPTKSPDKAKSKESRKADSSSGE